MNASFVMTSRWWVDAEPARVWPLVGDCRDWPRWLQSIHAQPGALAWRMPWPWASSFVLRPGRAPAPRQQDQWLCGPVRVRCQGLIDAQPGRATAVTLRLGISLDRPWLRHSAPWLLPWVAQRHFAAIRSSVPRLGELLGCPVGAPSEWAGYTPH
jgi:hypothetical protein